MMTVERNDCFDQGGKLERPRYFDHQLLTADDLLAEQEYFRHRLMRHNRFLHGWGVVCGLDVVADPSDDLPWRVRIDPGYALGPFGHEIQVPSPIHLDLALCGPGSATDPCDPALLHTPAQAVGGEVYVAIRYSECVSRPMRVLPDGCACAEETCEFSRVRSSFEITCLPELPASHEPPAGPLLCSIARGEALPPCPPCPVEPWVVLAHVRLPATTATEVAISDIDDFSFRRQVFSTTALQEQLIECCCRETQTPGADLTLTKRSDTPQREKIEYTIEITNLGPDAAHALKMKDVLQVEGFPLPDVSSVSNFHSSHGGRWTVIAESQNEAEYEAIIDILPAGEVATLGFDLEFLDPGSLRKVIVNTASVSSATHDPDLSNNEADTTDILNNDTP